MDRDLRYCVGHLFNFQKPHENIELYVLANAFFGVRFRIYWAEPLNPQYVTASTTSNRLCNEK